MRHLMTGTAGAGFWALLVLAQKAQSYFAILQRGSSKVGKELGFAPFLQLERAVSYRRGAHCPSRVTGAPVTPHSIGPQKCPPVTLSGRKKTCFCVHPQGESCSGSTLPPSHLP